jgi:predicted TIM-barrel fold metal-dependent hydrolase
MRFIPDTGVYIDTAAVGHFITPDVYRDIIRAVGADRVLFGSDSPWEDQSHALACLENTKISTEELELIKYKNAVKLFGLEM